MNKVNYQDQVADYLNGHLSEEQRQAFEQALSGNPELAEQLQFDARLQRSLRAQVPTEATALPHFAAVRAHIENDQKSRGAPSWLSGFRWLMPLTGAAFALVIGLMLLPGNEPVTDVQEFHVLSDPEVAPAGAVLQIIGVPELSSAELEELVQEYGLKPLRWRQSVVAVDVELPSAGRLAAIENRLAQDTRVRFHSVQTPER